MNSAPIEKPWFSYQGGLYKGPSPFFFTLDEVSQSRWMEAHYPDIEKEINQYIQENASRFEAYFNKELVTKKGNWKFRTFYFWGEKNTDVLKNLPAVSKYLEQIPGLLSAGISILEPHSDIAQHQGDTNTIARIHVGIKIPEGLPVCGLEVGPEQCSWVEGKALAFCDAHLHRAWNHSDQTRYVLIADVIRDEYKTAEKGICLNVRSLLLLQNLCQKSAFIRNLPGPFRGAIRYGYKFALLLGYGKKLQA